MTVVTLSAMTPSGPVVGATRALTAAAVALTAAAVAVVAAYRHGPLDVVLAALVVVFLAVPAVGSALARAEPRNPVGWFLLVAGLGLPLTIGAYEYSQAAYRDGHALPGARWAGWLDGWPWVPCLVLLPTVAVLLFPDGRLPSRRWRPLLWASWLVVAVLTASLLFSPGLLDYPDVANPTALPAAAGDVALTTGNVIALIAPLSTLSALALTLRWRRDGAAALRLVVPAAWLMAASWWSCILFVTVTGSSVGAMPVELTGMLALGVTAWVAIRRHGLLDARVVVGRALVHTGLTVCVVAVYLVVAAATRALAAPWGEPVAVAVAVLVALPLRDLLQRIANRIVHGLRDDPYAALDELGRGLEVAASDDVLPTVARTVRAALRLSSVEILLDGRSAATAGRSAGEVREELPLVFAGETIGSLVVEPAPGGTLSAADRRLLDGLARQVAAAGHAVSLTRDLRASRERIVAATEDERRRLRRDLHDGLGPGLAGVVLGLARARGRIATDPEAATHQLDALTGQVQQAVAEVRRLVHGLRPPALDELGLVGALDEQARALGAITVTGPTAPALPAAVEVAAYRIAVEAMTNAARHAAASACTVLVRVDEAVHVEVDDDGIGLPERFRAGVGITSMRERAVELGGECTVGRGATGGTAVRATIPLAATIPRAATIPQAAT